MLNKQHISACCSATAGVSLLELSPLYPSHTTPLQNPNALAHKHPQGIESLIKALQARGIAVYLISGGFRCV